MNTQTHITMPGILFMVLIIVLALRVEKKYLGLPFIMTAFYMTYDQLLVIGEFHFQMFRILILVSWVRIILRGEMKYHHINKIDKMVIYWVVCTVVFNTALWGTFGAFKSNLGFVYNVFGLYWIFRIAINSYEDMELIFKIISILIIPVAILMIIESATGNNLYAFLSGAEPESMIRDGWVRSKGPFRHPILAGTFGAAVVPLFVALYGSGEKNRKYAIAGIVSALTIVGAAHSTGPLMALCLGVVAFGFWKFRDSMATVRWGLLIIFISLNLYMKAPVWYIFARIGDVFGGGGYHRSYLIEQAFNHFHEWWLMGSRYTAHWFPYALAINPDSADITNQFIGIGTNAGILAVVLFVCLIVRCFKVLGCSQRISESQHFGSRFFIWAIGVTLFVHVVSFFSVSYFDQNIIFWYMLLAIISTIYNININAENNKETGSVMSL